MKRKYSLVCQSSRQRQNLNIALGLAGLNETLNQEYNYIITEFCNLRPYQTDNIVLFDTATINKMVDNIRFFINVGSSPIDKIFYINRYIYKSLTLSEKILLQFNNEHNNIDNDTNTLDSPSREYTDEDFDAAEICMEWLEIGIKHGAYLQSADN
jgi:hypothetical protein